MAVARLDPRTNGFDEPLALATSSAFGEGSVSERDPVGAVFAGSNGEYYTDWELERRLRAGSWRPCLRQLDPDRRLVETDGGRLLSLVPVDPVDLPRWTELRVEGDSARVVDRNPPPRAGEG